MNGIDLHALLVGVWSWARERLLNQDAAVQGMVIALALFVGWVVGRAVLRPVRGRWGDSFDSRHFLHRLARTGIYLIPTGFVAVALGLAELALVRVGHPAALAHTAFSLSLAWIAAHLGTSLLQRDHFWRRTIGLAIWVAAALEIAGLLGPATAFLDGLAFTLGDAHISLLAIIKAAILLTVLWALGIHLSQYLERKLTAVPDLNPSVRVLLSKTLRISISIIAVLAALGTVGIDLAALAVFSGAVGVGVGFGLRNVISNLVSGIILLLDKSIKPGDIIEVAGVYGWITSLRARYVSLVTRDGTEYLIPNEALITSQVVNWSYSDRNVRLKLKVGVAYGSDVRQALGILEDAAKGHPRVLSTPEPIARFMDFGDSSLDLELRYWIDDPEEGVANVASDLRLDVLDRFRSQGVEIPFPQRDVHIIEEGPGE